MIPQLFRHLITDALHELSLSRHEAGKEDEKAMKKLKKQPFRPTLILVTSILYLMKKGAHLGYTELKDDIVAELEKQQVLRWI